MKHLIVFTFFSILFLFSCKKEEPKSTVLNQNVNLNNNFDQSKLEGITKINGNLEISYLSNENLSILTDLVEVSGALKIFNNPNLKNLTGLQNLSTIGGNLIIHSCPSLQAIDAFGQTSLNGNLEIYALDSVQYIEPFDKVISLETLNFWALQMDSFLFLPNLQSVSGLVSINSNPNLTTTAFPNLEEIGLIDLMLNDKWENLNGFSALKKVNSSVSINQNQMLNDFSAFETLEFLPHKLTVINNENLKSLEGLENARVQQSSIWNFISNSKLEEFCSLKSIYENSNQIFMEIRIDRNKSNPTFQEILDNCP